MCAGPRYVDSAGRCDSTGEKRYHCRGFEGTFFTRYLITSQAAIFLAKNLHFVLGNRLTI